METPSYSPSERTSAKGTYTSPLQWWVIPSMPAEAQLWRDIEINRAIWDGIIPQFSGWILFLSWSLSFSLSLLHAHMHIIYTRYICEVRRAVNILNCNITYFRCFIISSSINYILWKWLDWRQKRKGSSQLKFKTVLWIMVVLIFWIPSNLPFSSVT